MCWLAASLVCFLAACGSPDYLFVQGPAGATGPTGPVAPVTIIDEDAPPLECGQTIVVCKGKKKKEHGHE